MVMPSRKLVFTDPIYMYLLVILIALPLGWFGHEQLSFLTNLNSYFLAIIFFFGALKIHPKEIALLNKQKGTIALFNLGMLIVLPIIVFIVVKTLIPTLTLPLLILAAMPTGMAAPLLTEIVGGRQSLALAITVTSSLLAPITVPLVIKLLSGINVEVNFWEMFFSIATIIVLPFIVAWILQRLVPKQIKKNERYFSPLSIITLGMLLTGVIAQQTNNAVAYFKLETIIWYLLIVSIFMAFFYLAGYIFAIGRAQKDKITLTVGFANMNFTLAIFLAHRYFNSPEVILPITVAVVPWFVFIIMIKFLISSNEKTAKVSQ